MFRLLAFVLCLFLPTLSQAASRYALVVGNDAYAEVSSLQKAVADAEAMAGELTSLGFETILATNVGRRDFNLAIADFTKRLAPGDTAVVFYAGHGVEIDGENYLLPTDIIAPSEVQSGLVTSESIALSSLIDRIRQTGVRTTLAFVDACRDNPFAEKAGRSIGAARGLGRIAAPEGTFVVFSAGAGQQALDRLDDSDTDPNSVFTRNLLPRLSLPGLELRDLVSDLRLDVRDLARTRNHSQFPAYYDELLGEFYFRAAGPQPTDIPHINPPPVPGEGGAVRADFELARQVGTPAALEAFLAKHEGKSDDFSLLLARQMLAELNGDHEEVAVIAMADPDPEPEPGRADEDPARAIMRQTQLELNRLGCNAGGADGVSGPRTRAAFRSFIAQSGTSLSESDLGGERALSILESASAPVCKSVAQVPRGAPTIEGVWSFVAKCPAFITTTGTLNYRMNSAVSYVGTFTDSLGQTGSISGQMDGLNFTQNVQTGVLKAVENGSLSPDGMSYTLRNSLGCRVTAQRQ